MDKTLKMGVKPELKFHETSEGETMETSSLNPSFSLLFCADTHQFYSHVPTQCNKYYPYRSP